MEKQKNPYEYKRDRYRRRHRNVIQSLSIIAFPLLSQTALLSNLTSLMYVLGPCMILSGIHHTQSLMLQAYFFLEQKQVQLQIIFFIS